MKFFKNEIFTKDNVTKHNEEFDIIKNNDLEISFEEKKEIFLFFKDYNKFKKKKDNYLNL